MRFPIGSLAFLVAPGDYLTLSLPMKPRPERRIPCGELAHQSTPYVNWLNAQGTNMYARALLPRGAV
jgi:hypothetical protein